MTRSRNVDKPSWDRAKSLSHALTRAQQQLAAAEADGAPAHTLRRLRRRVERSGSALFSENRGIARQLSRRYKRAASKADAEDIDAVADKALWEAILSWDPSRSPLASWARRVVLKALNVHVGRFEHGMSGWTFDKRPVVLQTARDLEAAGLPADIASVARAAGVTYETADVILAARARTMSLDSPVTDDGSATLGDLIDDDGFSPEDADLADASHDVLAEMCAHLDALELFSWIRGSGLDGAEAWSTYDMEIVLGVSAESVRRAMRRAEQSVIDGAPQATEPPAGANK